MNFMNWSPGQPASANAMQDCGAAGKDGTWFSVSCDEKHYGICEKIGMTIKCMQKNERKTECNNLNAISFIILHLFIEN